ncbi:MAG: Fe-S cluster assembly ATPase SufC [Candidatus Gracilibacteria bacterium]|nr:Fe-S cluster assembly ATPase SufC [Candidatus Gracilibacteria bacterium]
MLEIKNLSVRVDMKNILKDINLDFEKGKTYFLLGRNGSGKSSLALTIMGHPKYKVISGSITADGKDILSRKSDEISKAGIFLSFQNIPEIPGIRLFEFLRTIYNEYRRSIDAEFKNASIFLFKKKIIPYLNELDIPEEFLERDLNVGFSGGEKRKIELLQIKLLEPKYIILDEIDSGLDIDAFKTVALELKKLKNPDNTMIFITHNFKLLEILDVDFAYVLSDGEVIDSGGIELIRKIEKHGFCAYCNLDESCNKELKCE